MYQGLRHRSRIVLLWGAFALATTATGFALHRLYDTVRRELAEQSQRALEQEREKALARIHSHIDEVRRSTITELAGFHDEGLGHALRQWDEANEIITGTFQWDATRGFLPGATMPEHAGEPEQLVELWVRFRTWRSDHPAGVRNGPATAGDFRVMQFRTLENPDFAQSGLGYQSENLGMLSYAGRAVEPWAGWAARLDNPDAPWTFWYQAGPDAPVRGCFLDAALIVQQLREEITATRLARLELAGLQPGAQFNEAQHRTELLDSLPGMSLLSAPGEVFVEKQGGARLSAVTAASLVGVFLVGVALLTNYSRREAHDAARKTTFVSQVSHELRTPLTSIRMFADMLGNPGLAEEKRIKFAGTISRESLRLSGLIERLLTFNALERGTAPVAMERLDVSALILETAEETEGMLREAGMRIETALPAATLFAATDRSAAKQALLNLVENAIKYARDGGVVRLTATTARDSVCIRVADRGPGVAAALRSRIFEPFVQGGRALTDKPSGVGLGLSIARGLLRAAGGDLVLLSSESGATFEIRLPAASSP